MKSIRSIYSLIALVVLTIATSSFAHAQLATRTWVSGVGDDVNPCSRTAPCKTFAGAISKTAAAGEISVLDPGGFGAITITKSLTINGTQGAGYGSILAALVNGVIVNSSTAVVKLRNLDINGAGSGINGIRIVAAASVTVENTVIDGFTNRGISDERNTAGKLIVVDTMIRNTTGSSIAVGPTVAGVAVNVLIDNVRATSSSGNSGYSQSGTGVRATIRNSVFSHNSTGVLADSGELNINDCAMTFNTNGLFLTGTGLARLNNSVIESNGTSINVGGQALTQSTGTNTISGNTANNLPTGTPISQN